MTATLDEVLAEVAREHHWRWWTHGDVRTHEVLHCHACNWTIRQKASMRDDDCYDAFAAHLAAELDRAVAEWLRSDEVELEAAKAILDARRHRWDNVHQGECITDARAALDAVAGLCGGEK